MRILHVIEGMQVSCGVSCFVIEMAREMQLKKCEVAVVTTRNWNVSAKDVHIHETNSPEQIAGQFMPDIVHIHGCWNSYVHRMAVWCRRTKIPYIISPHGAWTPWAISYHKWKKRIAWWLYQKKDSQSASGIHVTVESEKIDAVNLCGNLPVFIAPLGIRLTGEMKFDSSVCNCKRILLSLGRLHPVKNIDSLLTAWKGLPANIRESWKLIIAGKTGPDNPDYLQILKLQADDNCQFIGEVNGMEKEALYRKASLFVLPSFSENFGVVVLESLAAGTPVVASSRTPWEIIVQNGCGWQCEPTVEAIQETLTKAMSMSASSLADMGQRGRQFVYENYSWEHSSQILLNAYHKILAK